MARTVNEVLTAAMDSVNLINSINTDAASEAGVEGLTQAQINDVVQRNVDHLGIILMYEPQHDEDDTPDVAGSSEDKTPYTDAIATGQAYIENN